MKAELAETLVRAYVGETMDEIVATAVENTDRHAIEDTVEYRRDRIRFSDGNVALDVPVAPSHRTTNGYLRPEVDGEVVAVELNAGVESREALSMADNGGRLEKRVKRQAESYHGHQWGVKWDDELDP